MWRLLPPVAAVTVVVLVIALLLALNSNPHRDTAGPALVSPTSHPLASSTPTPSSPPVTTPAPAVPATQVEAKRTSRPLAPALPVSVLNNSTRSGLAHQAAQQVIQHGWPVAKIGNFTGRIAESTLYYAPGQLASARRLAQEMPAIVRVLPRFAGLPTAGLTLVVTRDWPA